MPRLTASRLWPMLLVLVIAGLTARAVWHASTTETGWQFLEEQARWATLGWFIEPEPIVHRLPPEQAKFWLARTDEVLRRYPDDAEVAMGAALMLHRPDDRYRWPKYKVGIMESWGVAIVSYDVHEAEKLELEFELLCRERCLELAERATDLEPDNLAWWRLRGLLLPPYYHPWDDFDARIPDWEKILQTCAEHDPDNALYDYLAGNIHFYASCEITFDDDVNPLLEIHDAEQFAAGIACFERAQAKPLFVIGREGYRAVARSETLARLSSTQLPITMKGTLADHRRIEGADRSLRSDIHFWQGARAHSARVAGDAPAAFERYQQILAFRDQCEQGDANDGSHLTYSVTARPPAFPMHELAVEHPGLVDAEQMRQLEAAKDEAKLNFEAYRRAATKVYQQAPASGTSQSLVERVPTLRVFLAWLPRPIVLLGLIAGALGGLGCLIGGLSDRPVGPLIYLPLFAGCLGLSVTLLGLSPAEVIDPEVQDWLFTLVALGIPAVVAIGIVWALWTGKRPQFSLARLLVGMLGVSLLMGMFSLAAADLDALDTFPFQWSIPPQEIAELATEVQHRRIRETLSANYPGIWPLLQWWAYHGEFVAIGLWLTLLVVWQMMRDGRTRQATSEAKLPATGPTWRDWLGPPLRTLARAAVLVSGLLLIIYLAAAPALIVPVEQHYQQQVAFGRNPQTEWDEIQQNMDQAKAELRREQGLP